MPPRSRRLRERQKRQEEEADSLAVEASPEVDVDLDEPAPEVELEIDMDDGGDDAEPAAEAEAAPSSRRAGGRSRRGRRGGDGDDEAGAGASRSRRSSRRNRGGGDDEAGDDDAGASSKRGASRRSSRADSKKKSARKPKKVKPKISDEERARRRSIIIKSFVWIIILGGLTAGGIFAYQHFKEEPQPITVTLKTSETPFTITATKRQRAAALLTAAKRHLHICEKEIMDKRPDSAQKYQDDARALLQQPELGNAATENPSPEDPTIGSVQQAKQAFELAQEVEAKTKDINRVRNDLKVETNLRNLMANLSNIADEPDLDALEKSMHDFIANPVEPKSTAPLVEDLDRYMPQISQVKSRMDEIATTRTKRREDVTSEVQAKANRASDLLMDESKYGEALRKVDQFIADYPDAKLTQVRDKVMNGAREAWKTKKDEALRNYQNAIAAATSDADRLKYLNQSIEALQFVIDKFGTDVPEMQTFTNEAQEMIGKYKSAR